MPSMKSVWVWGALGGAVIVALVAMWRSTHTAAPVERGHRTANAAQLRASRLALPTELAGVYLGMDLGALRRARPRAQVNQAAEERLHVVYGEPLANAMRAVYLVRKSDFVLEKLQVASQLRGVDDIQPRITAHSNRYGAVTGVWDCPDRGKAYLATRRFTWQVEDIALMDVFLIVGESVSATLYAAPLPVIAESLRNAGCVATKDDGLTRFPVPRASVQRAQ
jgi:hypothetical protein